jgi:Uncharacterised protein family (UPF0203)
MDKVQEECKPYREKYNACFNSAASKLLDGNWSALSDCNPLFEDYRSCVQVLMSDKVKQQQQQQSQGEEKK